MGFKLAALMRISSVDLAGRWAAAAEELVHWVGSALVKAYWSGKRHVIKVALSKQLAGSEMEAISKAVVPSGNGTALQGIDTRHESHANKLETDVQANCLLIAFSMHTAGMSPWCCVRAGLGEIYADRAAGRLVGRIFGRRAPP